MHLTRCQDQKSQTLDEFYSMIGCKTMLDLLERLRGLPNERRVYGLTSVDRLCLLAEDTSASIWYVIISALDEGEWRYFVEYLMPQHSAPWPVAMVRGEARNEDDAVQMIITAMENSEGWSERR